MEVADRQSNFDPQTGRFVGASDDATFPEPRWDVALHPYRRDWAPRVGMAYDIFGTGRTVRSRLWHIVEQPVYRRVRQQD